MVVVSASEFRASQAKYLDMARSGETIVLRSRNKEEFTLKVKPRRKKNVITPELQEKIDRAREEFRRGECVECKTVEELRAYLDSL